MGKNRGKILDLMSDVSRLNFLRIGVMLIYFIFYSHLLLKEYFIPISFLMIRIFFKQLIFDDDFF